MTQENGPAVAIVSVAGLATIQDGGRPGRMHEGVPPGGALVPELLARANRAAGNAGDVAAIELIGSLTLAAVGGAIVVATEDADVKRVPEGGTCRLEKRKELRVRYVAVGGGLEVPRVLGGRGTLLVAGVGGYGGRELRKGDRLGVAGRGEGERAIEAAGGGEVGVDDAAPIRIVIGPDDDRFTPDALRLLLSEPFTLSPASDRAGSRLFGPRLPRLETHEASGDTHLSTPMVAGAIEVPSSGDPIVLGPDHPTTGGYPVLGVIVRADLGRFHAVPIASRVRFTRTDVVAPRRV